MLEAASVSASLSRRHLPRAVQDHLGQELRAAAAPAMAAPLPRHFVRLIGQLDRVLIRPPVADRFKEGLLAAIPNLRAFAISLTGDGDRADDLVQDAVLRAWSKRDRFQEGTNLNAWLFTILRNAFHSAYRKQHREVEDADGSYAMRLRMAPDQFNHLQMQDLKAALAKLSPEQRQILLLVAAEGLPYAAAAEICGVAVGTIKSRVNRARIRLAELMLHDPDDLATDGLMQAALAAAPRASPRTAALGRKRLLSRKAAPARCS